MQVVITFFKFDNLIDRKCTKKYYTIQSLKGRNFMNNFDEIKIVPSVLEIKACATDGAIVTPEELQLDEGKSIAELLEDEEKKENDQQQ